LDQVIFDLKQEGICVAAYINPYLNVKGDIYKQHEEEKFWLTDGNGQTLIQDFGQFNVSISV
jgi:alpha-glucosidase (family GH31 glycosyl hydrolase)